MNNAQLANHIVSGFYGRRQQRRARQELTRLQTQQACTQPKTWVLAHINLRINYKSGELARLVAWSKTRPADSRDWQEYLQESRAAYRATRNK